MISFEGSEFANSVDYLCKFPQRIRIRMLLACTSLNANNIGVFLFQVSKRVLPQKILVQKYLNFDY